MALSTYCMLNHILTGCPKALVEGRCRWRHDKILVEITKWVEQQRIKANNNQAPPPDAIGFLRKGNEAPKSKAAAKNLPSILTKASDWELSVDRTRKLVFPQDVVATAL